MNNLINETPKDKMAVVVPRRDGDAASHVRSYLDMGMKVLVVIHTRNDGDEVTVATKGTKNNKNLSLVVGCNTIGDVGSSIEQHVKTGFTPNVVVIANGDKFAAEETREDFAKLGKYYGVPFVIASDEMIV